MFRLEDLTLFVRAAALGSFSDAAREVGQQPAQVSAAIKRLETTLNIRLFARSTRSLRLTPEGEAFAALGEDYASMVDDGLLLDDAEAFDVLMQRCKQIAARANAAAQSGTTT